MVSRSLDIQVNTIFKKQDKISIPNLAESEININTGRDPLPKFVIRLLLQNELRSIKGAFKEKENVKQETIQGHIHGEHNSLQ